MNQVAETTQQKKPLPEAFIAAAMTLFGDRFTQSTGVREHHGRDESPFDPMLPDAVVFAQSTEEVAALLKLCNAHRVPVIPYGAGTSLEGHILAVQGGISLDVSQMNKILSINPEDLTVTVQPGVTRKQLNAELRDTGFFFPIDPGADASIGGMVSTRASGTNAVRYGSMRENTLALKVVTPDGQVARTGTRAKKSAAGYDLTRLYVGSEGTLGVVTEITVRLHPLPEAILAAVCSFPDIASAVNTVIETIQLGVPVARVEFVDVNGVRALNAHDNIGLPEQPLLLFEFIGSEQGVREQVEMVEEIASGHDALGFTWATRPEERSKLWAARHNAFFAFLQMRPGCVAISTDSCVPISRMAECLLETKSDCEEHGIIYSIIGHVGDGNFHVQMMVDPEDAAEIARAEGVNQRMVARVISMGGTCTGEHGIGMHKMDFLIQEHGQEAIGIMRAIKHALDPNNIMNPGKIIHW